MNPKRLLLITLAGGAAAYSLPLHAEATAAGSGRYELKNRSSFRIDADARVPFWPIGWKKPKSVASHQGTGTAVIEIPKIQLQPGHFNVTSILLGNPALATINGRTFEEGEFLPVIWGTERLRVAVRAIRDGGVWLEYQGQQIMVPIHRPELGKRQAEQKAQPGEFAIKIDPK